MYKCMQIFKLPIHLNKNIIIKLNRLMLFVKSINSSFQSLEISRRVIHLYNILNLKYNKRYFSFQH